jgi:hypothetical protein
MNDLTPPTDDHLIRLTWRRLDRLASAAALGMVLASPRSALLTVEMLRPRIQPPTSTTSTHAGTNVRRQGVGR